MERGEQLNGVDKTDPEYIRMYFEHQYDRFAKLELLAFAFTNIIVTPLSGVFLALGFSETGFIHQAQSSSALLFVALLNLFAVFYIIRARSRGESHRRRAKKILEKYARELFLLDTEEMEATGHQYGFFGKGFLTNSGKYGQYIIQILFHIFLLLISLWLWYLYSVPPLNLNWIWMG